MAAILKPTAVPNIFDSLPKYLQATQLKHIWLLSTNTIYIIYSRPRTSIPEPSLCSEEPTAAKQSEEVTPDSPNKRLRGRLKIAPEICIPNLLKKVNTFNHTLQRLQNTARIQKNLFALLLNKNKIQSAKLDSTDGCLRELVENEAKNKNIKKVYSQRIKEFAITVYEYSTIFRLRLS